MKKKELEPQGSKDARFFAWIGKSWRRMHKGDSVGWLLVTGFQALLTWGFMGLARLAEGLPWEGQVKMLVVVAIVVTWCMALRTIRARLLELLKQWNRVPEFFPLKDSNGDAHQISEKMQGWHRTYLRKSVLRLRIIAAGITMPFFILPVFTAAICFALNWNKEVLDIGLMSMALVLAALSIVVGGYFHWSVMPPVAITRIRHARGST